MHATAVEPSTATASSSPRSNTLGATRFGVGAWIRAAGFCPIMSSSGARFSSSRTSLSDSPACHADDPSVTAATSPRMSARVIVFIGCAPSLGAICSRQTLSYFSTVDGDSVSTIFGRPSAQKLASDCAPTFGSRYVPRSFVASVDARNRSASVLRVKFRACSRPSGPR
jgi:hypothetical protein